MLLAEGRERNLLEIHQSILFLARPALRRNYCYLARASSVGVFYQSLPDLGKGNTELQPTSAIFSHQRAEVGTSEKHV